MFPLHRRRIWEDMIKVFKIIYNFDKINPKIFFEINNAPVTRGRSMKLRVRRCNTIVHKSYFNVRVVEHWNRLPASEISSKTIESGKSRLDIYFRETGFYELVNWLCGISSYEIFMDVILLYQSFCLTHEKCRDNTFLMLIKLFLP